MAGVWDGIIIDGTGGAIEPDTRKRGISLPLMRSGPLIQLDAALSTFQSISYKNRNLISPHNI